MSKIPGLRTLIKIAGLAVLFISVNGCEGWLWDVQQMRATSKTTPLKVGTIEGPLSYSLFRSDRHGYEHDLLWEFAQDRGYSLQFITYKSEQEVLEKLKTGEVQVGAARLPAHWGQSQDLMLGPSYDDQKLVVTCRRDFSVETSMTGTLKNMKDLKLVVHRKQMGPQARTQFRKTYSSVRLFERDQESIPHLMSQTRKKFFDCLVADEMETLTYLRFFPSLEVKAKLGQGQPYHFVVGTKSRSLASEMSYWFQRAARRGEIGRIKDRYMTHLEELSIQDQSKFFRSLSSQLDSYKKNFKKSAKEFSLPWQLVAAVAYQESHWQHDAESFTGVKGLMQLTRDTAEYVGVEDRLDPVQSIWGGAKYLRYLLDKQPKDLPFRERLALALAAYNVGVAHLSDAQALAENLGKDPYSWKDLKTVLPLLSDPTYYDELKYGPARGQEPVDFVHRVLGFYDLMTIKI
ncbi:MAG: membrane-bound lytic murein transglycosylase MltF [Pseudobdellovibrionaceae bacterium]